MDRRTRRKLQRETDKDIIQVLIAMRNDWQQSNDTNDLNAVTAADFPLLEENLHPNINLQMTFNICRDRFLQYIEAIEIAINAGKTWTLIENNLGEEVTENLGFKVMLNRLQHEERMRRHKNQKEFVN